MKRVAIVVLLALALLPAFPRSAEAAPPKAVPKGATSARVWGWVDGDKFKVRIGGTTEDLLMLGVDAPEPENRHGDPECYAAEATAHLRTLVAKKQTVYLERDEDDRDGKDRLLRYVWVPGEGSAKAFLLNTKLVRDGYAGFDAMPPNGKYDKNLEAAEKDARDKHRGLWAACGGVHEHAAATTPVPAYASGGLGLTRAEWEAKHGKGEGDEASFITYERQQYLVTFSRGEVWSISWNLPDSVSPDVADDLALSLVPADHQFVGSTVTEPGSPADLYLSDSLIARFPPEDGRDPWHGDPPGSFIVIYYPEPDGLVGSLLIGIGHH
jgi:endonuclease YncB( thermonuclease family)